LKVKQTRRFLLLVCLLVAGVLQGQEDPSLDLPRKAPTVLTALLEKAKAQIGKPYRWGGMSPLGFDCSGFVRFVFLPFGVNLDHSSTGQAKQGEPVRPDRLQEGDLLFFHTSRRKRRLVNHVGIYLGDGLFIHASSKGKRNDRVVKISELGNDYYSKALVAARRVSVPFAYGFTEAKQAAGTLRVENRPDETYITSFLDKGGSRLAPPAPRCCGERFW
jgi:hypothetical protein